MELSEIEQGLKAPKSLHMNDVPEVARKQFIELAGSKFAGHYGYTLSYLMEVLTVFYPTLFEHEVRLGKLEGATNKLPDEKVIRTIGGRVIK